MEDRPSLKQASPKQPELPQHSSGITWLSLQIPELTFHKLKNSYTNNVTERKMGRISAKNEKALSSKNSMEMLMKKGKKKLRKITNAVK
jgi:hypothetical protein